MLGEPDALVALAQLVLAAAIGLAPAGLVSLAHGILLPGGRAGGPSAGRGCGGREGAAHAASRSAARRRALRARGLAAISSPVGVIDGRVTRRSRGLRPQTQIGTSGGQTQPRRSAWKKRLTIRSSREW